MLAYHIVPVVKRSAVTSTVYQSTVFYHAVSDHNRCCELYYFGGEEKKKNAKCKNADALAIQLLWGPNHESRFTSESSCSTFMLSILTYFAAFFLTHRTLGMWSWQLSLGYRSPALELSTSSTRISRLAVRRKNRRGREGVGIVFDFGPLSRHG